MKRVENTGVLERSVDTAERTEPSWLEDCCEDSRERRFPKTRQACQDRKIYENSAEESASMDQPKGKRAKNETWTAGDMRQDE